MLLQRTPRLARQLALAAVLGEPGLSALVLVLLATGLGLLLDFWVTGLHPVFSVGLLLVSIPVACYWVLRRTLRMDPKINPDYARNLALASVAGQAGCLTVIIVFMALFGGMFLDSRLDTHPVFTIGLVLLSVPVSLYAMIRLMLSSVASIRATPTQGERAPAKASPAPSDRNTTKENGS
ncbi:MAG: AtpZ/AtpI family protein [Aggregatilineaceae bacterium]